MAGRSECSQRAAQVVSIALSPMSALERITDSRRTTGRVRQVPVPDAFGVANRGIDQYQPIEKRRLLPEGLIRTMWSNARLFRGEAQWKSSWQFEETESGTPEGAAAFRPFTSEIAFVSIVR